MNAARRPHLDHERRPYAGGLPGGTGPYGAYRIARDTVPWYAGRRPYTPVPLFTPHAG